MYRFQLMCFVWICLSAFGAEVGGIRGTVVDKDGGEGLIGATVRVDGTDVTVFVDVNGNYVIRGVAPGTYALVASMDGFSETTVGEIVVRAGKETVVNMALGLDGVQESVTVTAELKNNTEISLLRHRQESDTVSDAIGGEEISRGGSGNAADAVTKVTGASVVGGKYILIRGLGDRYTSTHLNGVEMPTSDPDTKSFQADLLPSGLVDNIVTIKSFTPEKPGNFSGGIVDIATKSYPSDFSLDVSVKGGYNQLVTGNEEYIYYPGGNNWLGRDDGTRQLPDLLQNGNLAVPSITTARRNQQDAELLDAISRSFQPVMSPSTKKAGLDQGYSVSLGNRRSLFGRELGFLASVNYSRNSSGYTDRTMGRWRLAETSTVADSLQNQSLFSAREGKDNVTWGGLVTGNYALSTNHHLDLNILYSQSGESSAQEYEGTWAEQFNDETTLLQSRVLKYSERNLTSFQLSGKHFFDNLSGMSLQWHVANSTTLLDEPDTRIFTNHVSRRASASGEILVYSIARSNYNNPARYWRDLEEKGLTVDANLVFQIPSFNGLNGELKTGVATDTKDREFNELRFEYAFDSGVRYNGDPNSVFGPEIMGIQRFNPTTGRYEFGSVLQLAPDARGGDYFGEQTVDAAFAMVDLPVTEKFKMVTGLRYEMSQMEVSNGQTVGALDEKDPLPALSLVYEVTPDTNLRFAFGRTLAMPTFREKAPYASYDFIADGTFVGNPNLKRTIINNFDLRWERFPRPGELMSVSAFYKDFTNPIERAYNVRFASEFSEKTYLNVDAATVYGAEFEIRKSFDQAVSAGDSNHLFSIGGNVSLIKSEVDIPAEELAFIRQRDPEHSATRTLQGQSPFLVNLSLNYDSADGRTAASIYGNVFGERLDEVGVGGAPDALEQSRYMLDFSLTQSLYRDLKLKLMAKNLLNDPIEITQQFKGQDYIVTSYKTGTSYSLTLSFKP